MDENPLGISTNVKLQDNNCATPFNDATEAVKIAAVSFLLQPGAVITATDE